MSCSCDTEEFTESDFQLRVRDTESTSGSPVKHICSLCMDEEIGMEELDIEADIRRMEMERSFWFTVVLNFQLPHPRYEFIETVFPDETDLFHVDKNTESESTTISVEKFTVQGTERILFIENYDTLPDDVDIGVSLTEEIKSHDKMTLTLKNDSFFATRETLIEESDVLHECNECGLKRTDGVYFSLIDDETEDESGFLCHHCYNGPPVTVTITEFKLREADANSELYAKVCYVLENENINEVVFTLPENHTLLTTDVLLYSDNSLEPASWRHTSFFFNIKNKDEKNIYTCSDDENWWISGEFRLKKHETSLPINIEFDDGVTTTTEKGFRLTRRL